MLSNSTGVFLENESYYIMADDSYVGSISYVNSTIENQNFTYGNHLIQLKFDNVNASSSKRFETNGFININFSKSVNT